MAWFDDPEIVRHFPLRYRAYALYSRWIVDRGTGVVRGGSFLLRVLRHLTRALRLRSEAQTRINNTNVFVDLCDPRMLWVMDEVAGNSHEVRIMNICVSTGDTFLDVGANHGSYSLIAGKLVGQTGRIAAFEPQPRLAALIRKSFAANEITNCEVHEIVCCDDAGCSEFFVPTENSGAGSIYESYSATAGHRKMSVRMAKFDETVAWGDLPGRVFLKLDVEGSELSFLRGAANMIRTRHPTILFEINPTSARAGGYSIQDLLGFLDGMGYRCFYEIESFPHALPVGEIDCVRQRNLVASVGQI